MKPHQRLVFGEFLFIVASCVVLMYAYYFFAYWGTADLMGSEALRTYAYSGVIHLEVLLQSMAFGVLFGLINYSFERTQLRKRSFGQVILIKGVLSVTAMALVGLLTYAVFTGFAILPEQTMDALWASLTPRYMISVAVYVFVIILFTSFLVEVRRKFGPGNLWNLLSGRYHHPKIEHRVFLFLDLKGSTTIAEQLGHRTYSRFIRSCFHDLTDLVVRYDAQIYQYVGDEVVLSWHSNDGFTRQNCLNLFFAYEKKLLQKYPEYEMTYGVAPVFRGGMDVGDVTAAEVGDIKREIAYHGDVLNTAARLQGLCKTYEQKLLISERVHDVLSASPLFDTSLQGELTLRGKTRKLRVYSVTIEE